MKGLNPCLKAAVCVSASSYTHLTDLTIRAFATAYAALIIIIDDYFMDKPGPISVFNSHLTQGIEQEHPLLEAFARLLRELPKYWDPIMSDIMRQSAMTFITSFLVERQVQNTKVSFHSSQCSGVLNIYLSSATELRARPVCANHGGYIIDINHVRIPFWNPPRDIFDCGSGVRSTDTALITKYRRRLQWSRLWIMQSRSYFCASQTISDMRCSDVLSFYKEELAGETSNYISLRAKINKTGKLEELKNVVNDCLSAYRQIEQLERDFPAACGPLAPSWPAYLRSYLSVPRYKLLELLDEQNGY